MLSEHGLLYEIIYENINQVFSVCILRIYSFNNKNFCFIMRMIIEICYYSDWKLYISLWVLY